MKLYMQNDFKRVQMYLFFYTGLLQIKGIGAIFWNICMSLIRQEATLMELLHYTL